MPHESKETEVATKVDKIRRDLSVDQRNAIDLLVLGKTDQEVADVAGVSRQTVNGWRTTTTRSSSPG